MPSENEEQEEKEVEANADEDFIEQHVKNENLLIRDGFGWSKTKH